MLRGLFILIACACIAFLIFNSVSTKSVHELPSYLKLDEISKTHETKIDVYQHSIHHPDSLEIEKLKNDYSNLWAHLNHLYASNDVEAGKKYYTEDWFKSVSTHYEGVSIPVVLREDLKHELHILNWAWDGLVCCAIDSNVVLRYDLPDGSMDTTIITLGVVLLYQGSNWRIDAMRVLYED